MNENLIFEGNTVYELDPVCMKQKEYQEKTMGQKNRKFDKTSNFISTGKDFGRKEKLLIAIFVFLSVTCFRK